MTNSVSEICVMEEGRFEIFQGEQAQRLLDSGKIYLCQCDEECAPGYFAHFTCEFTDECDDDAEREWAEIERIASGGSRE